MSIRQVRSSSVLYMSPDGALTYGSPVAPIGEDFTSRCFATWIQTSRGVPYRSALTHLPGTNHTVSFYAHANSSLFLHFIDNFSSTSHVKSVRRTTT